MDGNPGCLSLTVPYAGAGPDPAGTLVRFDFPAPDVDPTRQDHFCMLAVVLADDDPVLPSSRSSQASADDAVRTDNNITLRNYFELTSSASGDPQEVELLVRSPYQEGNGIATLRVEHPPSWRATLLGPEGEPFPKEFFVSPGASTRVTVVIDSPFWARADQELRVVQQTRRLDGGDLVQSGLTVRYAAVEQWSVE